VGGGAAFPTNYRAALTREGKGGKRGKKEGGRGKKRGRGGLKIPKGEEKR